jgi:hypothetical protein
VVLVEAAGELELQDARTIAPTASVAAIAASLGLDLISRHLRQLSNDDAVFRDDEGA